MNLRSIREVKDWKGKKVLVRVDLNVEINTQGDAEEHFKLDILKETIDYLCDGGAGAIVLASHFGRPDGKRNEAFSLLPLADDVERALGRRVHFVNDCVGDAVTEAMESLEAGEIILLENLRFYAEEEANDSMFAERLAKPFDIFVNEAFSVCHRSHASVCAITAYVPSYAGLRLMEEVIQLEELQQHPVHPAVAVIGGAKIETKIPIIRTFEAIYDVVLVGGKIANEAQNTEQTFSKKVIFPVDFSGGERRLDIGPKTVTLFTDSIRTAKTIIWNGPMGKFEETPYAVGTEAIVRAIQENVEAHRVIGGGESLTLVEREGLIRCMGFVSAGGGAMLDFLGGIEMPGLDALTKRQS